MTNLFNLYGISKNGLINGSNKKCICGAETTANKCPNCGKDLSKSKLVNVAKNTALAKRDIDWQTGNILTYQNVHLLSTGFDLYEQVMQNIIVDLDAGTIKISNTAMFKQQTSDGSVFAFFDKYMPGFTTMVRQVAAQHPVVGITSMSEAHLGNILHVYLHYRGLYPYLLTYRILNFGNLINLTKYYPDVDFNDPKQIEACGLNLHLLSFWDIKNTKYIETIIEISQAAAIQADLTDMLIQCKRELEACLGHYNFDGNWALDTFSLLFNREISVEDFIRIFKRSHPEEFFMMKRYKTQHKKIYRTDVDWSTIKGLSKRDIRSMHFKAVLKENKMKTKDIEAAFATLDSNPLDALKMLASK